MKSLRLRSGRITVLIPARRAPRTFSLTPPIGSTLPLSVTSPVIASRGRTGLALATAFVYYPASASVRLPIAGSATTTLDSKVYANSLLAIYQTPLEVLGGNYAFGGAFAGIWMDLNGTVVTASGTRAASESASGIADVFLYPLMVGWTALGGDLKYDVRLRIYVPLGKYEAGSLANPGRNYWTFEPMLGVSFLSSQIGLEASAFTGLDFNTKNTATDYRSGEQFHIDATLAEHLPLLSGLVGMGATAFYYQQITGDTGSGATLGDFKARTLGVGPVASYARKIGGADCALEVKWLPELEVKNRIKGNEFWIKVRAMF